MSTNTCAIGLSLFLIGFTVVWAQPVNRSTEVVYLDQWPCERLTPAQCDAYRREWYHKSEGTQLMPFDWFMNIKGLRERAVSEFGFIADDAGPACKDRRGQTDDADNCNQLPVGFVRDIEKKPGEQVPLRILGPYRKIGSRPNQAEHIGISCAACHTSQLRYSGKLLRIDGGGGYGDFEEYLREMLRGIQQIASRDNESETSAALKFLVQSATQEKCYETNGDYLGKWGEPRRPFFGRLDGIGRGANNAFGFKPPEHLIRNPEFPKNCSAFMHDLRDQIEPTIKLQERNPGNAPVRIPAIWNAPRYDYVQWNHSIHQPMARNLTQALGVYTTVANVRVVDNLPWLESRVEQIRAPAWPEQVLGSIDRRKAAAGKKIFDSMCNDCHRGGPSADTGTLLELTAANVGTDRKYLENMGKMVLVDEEGTLPDFMEALRRVADDVTEEHYRARKVAYSRRTRLNGSRPNVMNPSKIAGYIARPLDGIWARAPYLHNGSVISLDQLLRPSSSRCNKFWVSGQPEFDPQTVGLAGNTLNKDGSCGQETTDPGSARARIDTSVPGNTNVGHEGPGFGTDLSQLEREQLIEYLKCLPRPRGSACPA